MKTIEEGIREELNRVESIRTAAFEHVQHGRFSKARKLIDSIKNTYCISEYWKAHVFIESLMKVYKERKEGAKSLILENNGYAWGDPDILYVLTLCNPRTDGGSRLFKITLKGGRATLGLFTQMSDDHICNLEIIANNMEEALRFSDEFCRFESPETVQLLSKREEMLPADYYHKGVIKTGSFRRVKTDSQSETEITSVRSSPYH